MKMGTTTTLMYIKTFASQAIRLNTIVFYWKSHIYKYFLVQNLRKLLSLTPLFPPFSWIIQLVISCLALFTIIQHQNKTKSSQCESVAWEKREKKSPRVFINMTQEYDQWCVDVWRKRKRELQDRKDQAIFR